MGIVWRPLNTRGGYDKGTMFSYLFLLTAKDMSCLLRSRGMSKNLLGIVVAATTPPANHLLFEDDSLIFVRGSTEGPSEIKEVIDIYC